MKDLTVETLGEDHPIQPENTGKNETQPPAFLVHEIHPVHRPRAFFHARTSPVGEADGRKFGRGVFMVSVGLLP